MELHKRLRKVRRANRQLGDHQPIQSEKLKSVLKDDNAFERHYRSVLKAYKSYIDHIDLKQFDSQDLKDFLIHYKELGEHLDKALAGKDLATKDDLANFPEMAYWRHVFKAINESLDAIAVEVEARSQRYTSPSQRMKDSGLSFADKTYAKGKPDPKKKVEDMLHPDRISQQFVGRADKVLFTQKFNQLKRYADPYSEHVSLNNYQLKAMKQDFQQFYKAFNSNKSLLKKDQKTRQVVNRMAHAANKLAKHTTNERSHESLPRELRRNSDFGFVPVKQLDEELDKHKAFTEKELADTSAVDTKKSGMKNN